MVLTAGCYHNNLFPMQQRHQYVGYVRIATISHTSCTVSGCLLRGGWFGRRRQRSRLLLRRGALRLLRVFPRRRQELHARDGTNVPRRRKKRLQERRVSDGLYEPGLVGSSCAAGFDRYWRSPGRH
jgi:hypothetical protein